MKPRPGSKTWPAGLNKTDRPPADRSALRASAAARRRDAAALSKDAASQVAAHFLAAFSKGDGTIFSGYAAFGDELDPAPLIAALRARGAIIALPVVERKGAPLVFRIWDESTRMAPGPFGIAEPTADSPAVRPDILLVPLLLADLRGYRLGYGGGFYDRTIAALRAAGGVCTIGLAYEAQVVSHLDAESWDEKLDHLVTESGVRHFDRS